ncbi:hypothetical protein GCM10025864_28910 [Luteimicrobium album]|uniref:Uncharacterized protein n=1 Tax=Luteimicrobium album TaxID=1054550 RepID=A0ABQ6I3S3_9MICO|nr:hypothetical protein GCM10025864_28910 [Luteimicrobium album]
MSSWSPPADGDASVLDGDVGCGDGDAATAGTANETVRALATSVEASEMARRRRMVPPEIPMKCRCVCSAAREYLVGMSNPAARRPRERRATG